jgi:hypothetical protein
MKSLTPSIFAALIAVLLVAGCATTETPRQGYERFKREEYVLFATNASVPLLALSVREVTLDGQVMLVQPTSPWANAIRHAITNLFTGLAAREILPVGTSQLASPPGSPYYRGALTFTEKTRLHGGSVAKGALVAGLTLGIVGNSAVKFDLESALDLQLTRYDGNQRQYATTNTVTGENRPRDNGAGWSAARLRANSLNVNSLAAQIADDKPFYAARP